jgi:hypothetical protein
VADKRYIARLTLDVEVTIDDRHSLDEVPDWIDGFNTVIELPMADVHVVAGHSISEIEALEEE